MTKKQVKYHYRSEKKNEKFFLKGFVEPIYYVNNKYQILFSEAKPKADACPINMAFSVEPKYYFTNYTYQYPWVRKRENTLYHCNLDTEGFMRLTDQKLVVFEDSKLKSFNLNEVSKLEMTYKKFIAPLVIGGIVAPLALLVAIANIFQFWIGMGAFVCGLLLFYYGMQGGHQIVIHGSQTSYQFFVTEKSKELEWFVGWANNMVAK